MFVCRLTFSDLSGEINTPSQNVDLEILACCAFTTSSAGMVRARGLDCTSCLLRSSYNIILLQMFGGSWQCLFFNVFTVVCIASQDSVFDIRLYGESHYDVEPPKRGKWVELARCVYNTG